MTAIHGILRTGALYVPVDPTGPAWRAAGILAASGVKGRSSPPSWCRPCAGNRVATARHLVDRGRGSGKGARGRRPCRPSPRHGTPARRVGYRTMADQCRRRCCPCAWPTTWRTFSLRRDRPASPRARCSRTLTRSRFSTGAASGWVRGSTATGLLRTRRFTSTCRFLTCSLPQRRRRWC